MVLECDSFYFYPDGDYKTTSRFNEQFQCYESDIEQYSTAIRIFGTRKQIDKALDDYCEASGLNVDEVYKFKDKESLNRYAQVYKNKALIINIR